MVLYFDHTRHFPKVGDRWLGGQVVTVARPATGYVEMVGPSGQLSADNVRKRLEAKARQDGDWYGMIVGFDVSVLSEESRVRTR